MKFVHAKLIKLFARVCFVHEYILYINCGSSAGLEIF